MADHSQRVLSVEEAARILYSTPTPTEQQLGKVRTKISKGVLKRSPKGNWTTTAGAIAEYLSAVAAQRQDMQFAKSQAGLDPPPQAKTAMAAAAKTSKSRPHPAQSAAGEVSHVYRDMLRDYFLAVTLRRRARSRSRAFDRAVIAGQVGVLLLAGLLLFSAYSRVFVGLSPEQAAVHHWLEKNTDHYTVVQWFPLEHDEGSDRAQLRVQYKYQAKSRKSIVTDRIFLIQGGNVASVRQAE